MGGHNKWSQIKRQKGANDIAKSRVWGKLGKRITVESKKAGGDANAANVRSVVEMAKKENMPKDAIERAVAKGASTETSSLEVITYETYGPGGVAIIIETLTDSRNRTAQEMKHLLSELGLALAAPGSAMWAFTKTGMSYEPQTTVPLSEVDGTRLAEILEAIDANDDVENIFTNDE
jgi:YebC/PmpR family DNA-binding regulatory protein